MVAVDARVGVKGKVEEFTAEKGEAELIESVKAALSQWRYTPLKLDGIPREVKISVEVAFTLR